MKNANAPSPSFSAIHSLPYSQPEYERQLTEWEQAAHRQADDNLQAWMREAAKPGHVIQPLLAAIFGNSPYISRLLLHYPHVLHDMVLRGADAVYAQLIAEIKRPSLSGEEHKILMRELRVAKHKLALLTAAADISGIWPLEKVTAALSEFAECCIAKAVDALLAAAHKRGEIILPFADEPSRGCGIAILGLGKLGGRELNYSSDIDLMFFFDSGKLPYHGRHSEQHFMNKLAHDVVYLLQERTADGYVFRTDLRLRPDPASTPPAISTVAAHYYYEGVGQNWERAAMIKARPVAGDIPAAEHFLKGIAPFMWRRNLDFAAINDIHSIKRQMDTHQNKDIQVKGHNIKLGLGGIREIEFYVQIHQLIWGGRQMSLKLHGTCETLAELVKKGLVEEAKGKTLHDAYVYLRTLEHRLQMIADEQTHTLPEDDGDLKRVASFMGYDSVEAFSQVLIRHLSAVHAIYAASFKNAEKLGDEGNLVFTGVSHDPETLQTIRHMHYAHPETISEIIMGWHHGSCRATRTKRARELLTELMPALLKRLGETANPDAAFLKFNDFLRNLPAGVQIFSLLGANPKLLGLIADIMGSAPTLAEYLSRRPALLDAVLSADFYGPLPAREQLAAQLAGMLAYEEDFEGRMDALRRFRNEKQFQAGVQLLRHMIDAHRVGTFLSDLADVAIQAAYDAVLADFVRSYGAIKDSAFAVIGLGKLGSRELTFGSDIDLVFVYDAPDGEALSNGEKSFSAGVYYNRLAQRFLSALTIMSNDGRLYEVDTRLRPSGEKGALVTNVQGLERYFDELAWTFEYMAFTKARVVVAHNSSPRRGEAGRGAQPVQAEQASPHPNPPPVGEGIKRGLEQFIIHQLTKPRDAQKLRADVADMRERIAREFGAMNEWDIKYARGGSIDVDFIAQYLMLLHAPDTPGAKPGSAAEILAWLKNAGRIGVEFAGDLLDAERFLGQIFHILRLCSNEAFDEAAAPDGLKKIMAQAVHAPDFAQVKQQLLEVEDRVRGHYNALFNAKENL